MQKNHRQPRYGMEEHARRGREIYERVVLPQMGKGDKGKFVAIDIDTERFELADSAMTATDQMLARLPGRPDLVRADRVSRRGPLWLSTKKRASMTGSVNADLEAILSLSVLDAAGQAHRIRGIIDTGFNGYLTLLLKSITKWGLRWRRREPGMLADNSLIWFDTFGGTVMWNGQRLRIEVEASDSAPLIGMNLLQGYELQMTVRDRGLVTVLKA